MIEKYEQFVEVGRKCENCPCEHETFKYCAGCEEIICLPCWLEHNNDDYDNQAHFYYRKGKTVVKKWAKV